MAPVGSRMAPRGFHTWLIPTNTVLGIFGLAVILTVVGIILLAVGGGIGALTTIGSILLTVGLVLLIVCLFLCVYAYCVWYVRDAETQTMVAISMDSPDSGVFIPTYAVIDKKTANGMLRDGKGTWPKKHVTISPTEPIPNGVSVRSSDYSYPRSDYSSMNSPLYTSSPRYSQDHGGSFPRNVSQSSASTYPAQSGTYSSTTGTGTYPAQSGTYSSTSGTGTYRGHTGVSTYSGQSSTGTYPGQSGYLQSNASTPYSTLPPRPPQRDVSPGSMGTYQHQPSIQPSGVGIQLQAVNTPPKFGEPGSPAYARSRSPSSQQFPFRRHSDDYDNTGAAEITPILYQSSYQHSPQSVQTQYRQSNPAYNEPPPPQPQALVRPSQRRPMTFEQVSSSKVSLYDNVLMGFQQDLD